MVPPPCDQIMVILGKRRDAPPNTMRAIARVVSVPYSIAELVMPGTRLSEQSGIEGWT